MKAVLCMGCDGRTDLGFTFCSGVHNVLIDFEAIRHTASYQLFLEYLDRTPKLFDGPSFNGNVIMNTVYKAVEMGYIDNDHYALITQYFHFHKRCGLWLRIEPK
jgi:hypothetical protein